MEDKIPVFLKWFFVVARRGVRFFGREKLVGAATRIFVVVAGIALSGCASVSVYQTSVPTRKKPKELPQKIFVGDFGFSADRVRVDRSGEDLERFERDTQERMRAQLVRRLTEKLVQAEGVKSGAVLPKGNYWLLEGNFDRIHQGSRALRSLIGFGVGRTKVETTAKLYDLSERKPKLLYVIRTTGGTGSEPGAVGGISPWGFWGVPTNAILAARGGLVLDTVRSSREITAAVSEYAYKNKLIGKEKALFPKRAGEIPPAFSRILPTSDAD